MIDIFMLVMCVILMLIIVVINIYLLAYFCAEDDNSCGTGIIAKIIVILGMLVGLGQVCLLPLDVANIRGEGGDFPMHIIWVITYLVIILFVCFILPISINIYGLDPEWTFCEKFKLNLCFIGVLVAVVAALFGITFIIFRKAHIDIDAMSCGINLVDQWSDSDKEVSDELLKSCEKIEDKEIVIRVSIFIYMIGLFSFASYLLFMLFGGVGIFAFPLDLIYSYCTRPIKIKKSKIEEMKKEIVVTAADLKDLGMQIKKLEEKGDHKRNIFSKARRNYNDKLKKLKVGVNVLDDQYEIINMQNEASKTSALGYLLKLIAGIFCMILTALWIVQIVLYILIKIDGRPLYGFLNVALVALTDANVSFIAIIIFVVLTFYLLIVTVKGNFKFGLRFMFIGSIHPMKKDKTYMDSIMFNVLLIMLTSVAVIQFSVRALGEYTSMTDADIISIQINNLTFFSFFFRYNIFEYGMLLIAIISFIYLICRPHDTNTVKKILHEKLENDKKKKDSTKEKPKEMTIKNSINDDEDDDE